MYEDEFCSDIGNNVLVGECCCCKHGRIVSELGSKGAPVSSAADAKTFDFVDNDNAESRNGCDLCFGRLR